MAARPRTPREISPLAPEPPDGEHVVEHTDLTAHEEWEDEVVEGADLVDVDAASARFTRCELRNVRLTGARVRGLHLVDVLAIDCEFSGALLQEARLQRVEFRNCRMSGVVLGQAVLHHVRFAECKLDDANLRLVEADHVQFESCSLRNADLLEARVTDSAVLSCDLRAADFTKAIVPGLRLAGSDLEGVRGALHLRGAVVEVDQTIPLALSLFAELGIELRNGDGS